MLRRSTSSSYEGLQISLWDAEGVQDADVGQVSTGAERVNGRGAHPELSRGRSDREKNILDPQLDPEIRVSAVRYGRFVGSGCATASSEIEDLGSEWSAVKVRESKPSELPRRRSPVRSGSPKL